MNIFRRVFIQKSGRTSIAQLWLPYEPRIIYIRAPKVVAAFNFFTSASARAR